MYSRGIDNKTNHTHEIPFRGLFAKCNSFTIFQRNPQLLAVAIFKVTLNVFLAKSNIHLSLFGFYSIANITRKMRNKIPNGMKEASSFKILKTKFKK